MASASAGAVVGAAIGGVVGTKGRRFVGAAAASRISGSRKGRGGALTANQKPAVSSPSRLNRAPSAGSRVLPQGRREAADGRCGLARHGAACDRRSRRGERAQLGERAVLGAAGRVHAPGPRGADARVRPDGGGSGRGQDRSLRRLQLPVQPDVPLPGGVADPDLGRRLPEQVLDDLLLRHVAAAQRPRRRLRLDGLGHLPLPAHARRRCPTRPARAAANRRCSAPTRSTAPTSAPSTTSARWPAAAAHHRRAPRASCHARRT